MEQTITIADRRVATRLLSPPDMDSVQGLFDRCPDYFEIATGSKAQPDEARRAFVAGPPSKDVSDKRIIGMFDGDALIGVIDALKDWPEDSAWTLGMLLLDPSSRGSGFGPSFLSAFEAWSVTHGAKKIRTALVSHHDRGLRFLERAGYERRESFENYSAGSRVSTIQFFEKTL